ncbi:CRE-PAR-3 protein [Caenorhabditis remanei]|uniref:CRE-PAR-3 protein n=1 Tax=Caenorhabditis remanei TaxID=31234 RepID=E3LYY8_CAERE|nr:CRE-PAR-3 protein [Caenorhabditis remanei]
MHTGGRSRYDSSVIPPPPPYHFNHVHTPPQRVIQQTHRSRDPPVYSPNMTTTNDNVTGSNDRIRVHRLECASDGGILDMDDVLEEVFDLNYDQILAITDEANGGTTTPTYSKIQKQQHHYAQPLPYSRKFEGPSTPIASAFGSVTVNHQAHRSSSPYNVGFARATTRDLPIPPSSKDRRDSVVEVSSFENIPQSGLRVSVTTPKSDARLLNEPILRSSLRTEPSGSRADDSTPTKHSRVTLSPEVEKRLAEQEGEERRSERRKYEKNGGRFNRGSDRKSRITDALLDARDRIADQLENEVEEKKVHSVRGRIEQGPLPGTTLITFLPVGDKENDLSKQMGIEVNAVFDESSEIPSTSEPSKLNSIQVMKIEEGGRVGKDGRIRVGDCILAIDGKFVDQMSIIRARASISELASINRPITLVINRTLDSFLEQESAKPIQSALQQANTQYIVYFTETLSQHSFSGAKGFGFTVTGRETSKGERLFYIGTVKPYGVALGHLKSGDRLLEINGTPTGQFTQLEIVEKLKETMVGAKIKFLVARVSQTNSVMNSSSSSENKENEETPKNEEEKSAPQKLPLPALMTPPVPKESPPPSSNPRFDIVIPFINGSSSAGLGVSLKARVSKKSNGTKVDCGIFIKNVMHGGAAFKEGGLRVNDRIIGVEDLHLESFNNMEAQAALSKKLKEVGMVRSSVRLTILRDNDYHPGHISRDLSRITVDASSPSPSSRMSSHTAPDSLLQSPHTRATSSSGPDSSHSRQSSSSSAVPALIRPNERDSIISDSTNRHDESELPDTDPFNREGPGRKSLSEKRGMGAAADPQHIKLFQEIKHQRQNSAPTSSTQKRSKSQPRSLSQRNYRSPMKLVDLPQPSVTSTVAQHVPLDDSDMLNRRSQSMESINRPVESILRGTGQINPSTSSKVQFMQNASPDQHPFPPGSALLRLKNEESRSRDKSRRKSMGNAMRNFFGFGSKSRDASPEKAVELRSVERPKSIIDERGGKEQLKTTTAPPPPPPHQGPRRGSGGNVFVDYGEPYGLIPQYPHNTTSGYESYADSELYDRYAAHRYYPRRGIDEDEYIYRQQSSSSLNPSSYVNYGLPASNAYHVDARVPSKASGSVSKTTMRRVFPTEYEDDSYQHIPQSSRYQQDGSGRGSDYHHMFNSWFAYTGGGAVGAAPVIKSSYGPSPVRIAAASAIERGESFAVESGGGPPPPPIDRRGRTTSGGAIPTSTSGPSGFHSSKEKYADARSGKFNGGSTRLFIPRHGGGLSAAAFATNFGSTEGYETRGGSGSPSQYRRRDQGPPHRFPQY